MPEKKSPRHYKGEVHSILMEKLVTAVKQKYLGIFFMSLSTIFFSAASLLVKIAASEFALPATQISFARFFCGLLLTIAVILAGKHPVKPVKYPVLFMRAIFNTAAVIFFFISIDLAGVTKGNIYNLTFPVFVAIFAPFLLKEKLSLPKALSVAIAFFGAYLVSGGGIDGIHFAAGDIAGLMSGFTAGFAIIALRKARLTETSLTILLFLMSIGTVINGIVFFRDFIVPDAVQTLLLILVGLLTFAGQMSITYGYKYIDALPGAVISTSRIFIAALLASLFLGEIVTPSIATGGFLIFLAVVGISYFGKSEAKSRIMKN